MLPPGSLVTSDEIEANPFSPISLISNSNSPHISYHVQTTLCESDHPLTTAPNQGPLSQQPISKTSRLSSQNLPSHNSALLLLNYSLKPKPISHQSRPIEVPSATKTQDLLSRYTFASLRRALHPPSSRIHTPQQASILNFSLCSTLNSPLFLPNS